MSWELTIHEFELGEGRAEMVDVGHRGHSARLREENDLAALVLVESLSGRADAIGEVLVRSPGANFEASQAAGSSAHVLTGFVARSAGITVEVRARLKDRFRVSILRLRRKLAHALSGSPCDLCKSIAKIIARGLLAANGLSLAGAAGSFDALLDCDIGDFIDNARKTPLWRWIENAGLEIMVFALVGPLFLFIKGARAVEDWIYEETCRAIGPCKDLLPRRLGLA